MFVQDLENQADGTVDYGRLNQELSVTATTLSPDVGVRTGATLAALQDVPEEEAPLTGQPSERVGGTVGLVLVKYLEGQIFTL